MLEGLDAAVEAGDGVAGAGLVDGDLAGAIEIPADEGNLPERLFGHDAELEGEASEEDRGVVVTKMVRGVDGGLVEAELLFADEGDGGEAERGGASGPRGGR